MSIQIICENRKARHDYEIIETFEAGLALLGSEVKSMRDKQMQLKDSYVAFRGDEAYLQNAHIAVYKSSSYNNSSVPAFAGLDHRNPADGAHSIYLDWFKKIT